MAASSISLARIAGARRAPKPGFIDPCLATPADNVPQQGQWSHEIKYDGYRIQAHLERGKSTLFTRRGFDWTELFGATARALELLDVEAAIIDGEIYVPDANGRADFHLMETDLNRGRDDRFVYCAFDLLYLNRYDLRDCALRDRKALLHQVIGAGSERVFVSAGIEAESSEIFQRACEMNLEGVVSKRLDAPYRSGRQKSWLKRKCRNTDSVPVVAFVEKLGARPRRIASLYLGRYEDGRLLYAGKAQTGFKTQQLYELREKLDPYIRSTSPLNEPIDKPKATWVEPRLYAEIEFSSFTANGRLRAPVYKGMREDLSDVAPRPARHTKTRRVSSTNILQLLPDATPPDWDELASYWQRIHQDALMYLARRPLKLVRHVAGQTFYHKGKLPPVPSAVHQLQIEKREGGAGTRVWVDDLAGLLGLLEMDVVELHPWNAIVDDIEHADTMVFDLDPGPGIGWTFVVDTALTLRELLDQHGLEHSWPKLSGGKGIHVMAPLTTRITHDAAHRRSREISELLASTDPDRYTVAASPAQRRGRVFIDFLRNGRGTTAVGTYSPRARPGYPIAAPVTWHDVERGVRPDTFNIGSPPRLEQTSGRRLR
ncbi:DNA ligase D [Peristeroidobacter agariperforans]|uniref:DNA ligase D n=1 Tax=Peristeroidobacter agariperforans TaxID=268404 RepID=UPI00101DE2D4|nr:DNA ligase D [Peristeroidobacter agariperforans]